MGAEALGAPSSVLIRRAARMFGRLCGSPGDVTVEIVLFLITFLVVT